MARRERGGQKNQDAGKPSAKVVSRTTTTTTTTSRAEAKTSTAPSLSAKQPASHRHPHARDDGSTGYLGRSAPFIEAPRWQRRHYIDRPADLVALAKDLTGITVLALDAEFAVSPQREQDKPVHQLSLLQLAIDEGSRSSFVVDAQRITDLSPLVEPLQNGSILKLFHSIGADAKVLAARDLVAANTLDLEAVSRSLFGTRGAGLQSMVLRASGIWLDKTFQRADWSRRPLTPGMRVYAAKDAELTLLLYRWLEEHYTWAVRLHHSPAGESTLPNVAEWILSSTLGPQRRHAGGGVVASGISTEVTAQEDDLRTALQRVHHPALRARVMRLVGDLELQRLAPDLYPYLASPAADERQAAVRVLGRLQDRNAVGLIRLLLGDAVQDVRQAAALAVEQLSTKEAAGVRARVKWSNTGADEMLPLKGSWQERLRAHFGVSNETDQPLEEEDEDEMVSGDSPRQ
jgi:3'-5' exonuclease/HEAT repeats